MPKQLASVLNLTKVIRISTIAVVLLTALVLFVAGKFIARTLGVIGDSQASTSASHQKLEGINDDLLAKLINSQQAKNDTERALPAQIKNPFATQKPIQAAPTPTPPVQ